jgi:Phage conserved hypothetical protein BR0599/Uncharacterized conserved protein (DUF2163)
MSYISVENSTSGSQLIELYLFVGSSATYALTSADRSIAYNGNTYIPTTIKRSSLKVGNYSDDSVQMTVDLPITAQLVIDYAMQISPPDVNLTMYRGHINPDGSLANDWVTYWNGTVYNFSIKNNVCTLTIPSIFGTALTGSIPTVYYQNPCNHVLFDARCGILRSAFSIAPNIVSVSGTTIVVDDIGSAADGTFLGGELAYLAHNSRRTITSQVGTTFTVNYEFADLPVGTNVSVTTGCNHAYAGDCLLKYNNTKNFGGFPYIPTVNPFADGIGS